MQSPFHFSSMGKVHKEPKQLAYKKPFAGLSEEEFNSLLGNRFYYSQFYYKCFIAKKQRSCGPKFEDGTRIDRWKKRERVYKHYWENALNEYLSGDDKVSFGDNPNPGPVGSKRKKKQK